MPRIEIERIEEAEEVSQTSTERFDRIAFARRALALVSPPSTTVAICAGARNVSVDSGRQWGDAPAARWAVLAIPHNASRHAIAAAVLELIGAGPARPWALDLLISGCASACYGRALGRP